MKNTRFYLVLLGLFALGSLTANAAQLASAKVMSLAGTVTYYGADGESRPLQPGEILVQGDSVVAAPLSFAKLVFSNGSELKVEENTSITIAKLEQASFGGNKSYEQLQADPSQSQALLELNYGKVDGHVKKLATGSNFAVQTAIGTAAIRGTTFTVEVRYSAECGEYIMITNNKDGKVDIISRYSGGLEFGKGSVGDKGYDSSASKESRDPIPAAHIVIIRLNKNGPQYNKIVNQLENYPPFRAGDGVPPVLIPGGPILTDPDGGGDEEIISPSSAG